MGARRKYIVIQTYCNSISKKDSKMAVVLVASFKGGVGKSTIANFLAEKLKNGYVLNLDLYQDNEEYNSSETINIAADEPLKDKIKDSDICIIDAGGFDDSRLYNIDIDLFVFVTRTDYRSIKTTVDTAATMLAKSNSNNKKIMFVVNQYENDKELEKAVGMLQEILSISDIEADDFYSVAIKKSNAITTAINNKMSLEELYRSNKAAYRKINEEFEEFAKEVKEIIKER